MASSDDPLVLLIALLQGEVKQYSRADKELARDRSRMRV
jgi:hypothetical protein